MLTPSERDWFADMLDKPAVADAGVPQPQPVKRTSTRVAAPIVRPMGVATQLTRL